MRWTASFFLVVGLAVAGCSNRRRSGGQDWSQTPPRGGGTSAPAPPMIVTPAQGTTGRITSLNPTVRYVVISYAVGLPLPPVEQRLNVYRAGLKVAEIKVSGPSRDTHTVADIIAGECQVGDEVRAD